MKVLDKDKFRNARGSYSRLIDINCMKCKTKIAVYQKDGPGDLKRMYLDRILYPENLTNLNKKELNAISNLICPNCKELLGVPYVYPKELRKAFRLYQSAVAKKIRKI